MIKPLLFFAAISLFSLQAISQFSQAYAPANWTVTKTPTTALNSASVNSSGAPASVVLVGSDNGPTYSGPAATIDYTITAIASGTWSFNWAYHSNDLDADPQYDIAYALRNGIQTALSSTSIAAGVDQSGSYSISVNAGDVIGFRITATDNGYGNATLTITSFSPPGGVLPVTYTYFNGLSRNNAVELKWGTATEVNADRFEVQRAEDGTSFKQIGVVKATGNTTVAQHYAFYDYAPGSGTNHYRLRQVDADGTSKISDVVIIRMNKAAEALSINVYPNPARQSTVTLSLESRSVKKVSLYDVTGKLLETRNASGTQKIEWNIAALKAGTYFFRTDDNAVPHFFIKQ